MSQAMDGHGNPFWSEHAQEEMTVRLARPSSLPEELPLVPEDMQDELSIEAGYEHAEDLVEFENELRASSAVQANGPEGSAGEDHSRGELSGQLQANGAGGAINASGLPGQAGPVESVAIGASGLPGQAGIGALDTVNAGGLPGQAGINGSLEVSAGGLPGQAGINGSLEVNAGGLPGQAGIYGSLDGVNAGGLHGQSGQLASQRVFANGAPGLLSQNSGASGSLSNEVHMQQSAAAVGVPGGVANQPGQISTSAGWPQELGAMHGQVQSHVQGLPPPTSWMSRSGGDQLQKPGVSQGDDELQRALEQQFDEWQRSLELAELKKQNEAMKQEIEKLRRSQMQVQTPAALKRPATPRTPQTTPMVTPMEPRDVVMTTPGGTRVPDGPPPEECQRRELPQVPPFPWSFTEDPAMACGLGAGPGQHPVLREGGSNSRQVLHGHGARSRREECQRVPVPGLGPGVGVEGHECGTTGRHSSDQQRLLQMEQELRALRGEMQRSSQWSGAQEYWSMPVTTDGLGDPAYVRGCIRETIASAGSSCEVPPPPPPLENNVNEPKVKTEVEVVENFGGMESRHIELPQLAEASGQLDALRLGDWLQAISPLVQLHRCGGSWSWPRRRSTMPLGRALHPWIVSKFMQAFLNKSRMKVASPELNREVCSC